METIKLSMYPDKTTPGTVRYSAESTEDPAVTTVYIRKAWFNGGEPPAAIEIEIREKA